jgi:predicted DNA-binding transcriptional regulator AlpA
VQQKAAISLHAPSGRFAPTVSPDAMMAAISAYHAGEGVDKACARFGVNRGTFYWWMKRHDIPLRKHADLDERIKAAMVAYETTEEKVQAICARLSINSDKFYFWINALEIPKRGKGKRKTAPDPHVRAAVHAYARGVEVAKVGVSESTLYPWLKRMGVPKRRAFHTGKAGHPPKAPWIMKCDWCGDPLSQEQVKKRRKYCCEECQRDGVEDAKRANKPIIGLCPAPGCGIEIYDDTPFCSWKCHKAVMEARFG